MKGFQSRKMIKANSLCLGFCFLIWKLIVQRRDYSRKCASFDAYDENREAMPKAVKESR